MKKIISLSAFALTVVLLTHQQASAWHNIRFRTGIDFNWQSGGNTWFWKAFTGATSPHQPGHALWQHDYGMPPPMVVGQPPVHASAAPAVQFQAPAPTPANDGDSSASVQDTSRLTSYPSYGYQSYYPQSSYGYQPVGYYYPDYSYYYGAPSYWYGY